MYDHIFTCDNWQGLCNGIDSKEMEGEILTKVGGEHDHHHNHHADIRIEQVHSHSQSHMHHMDPTLVVFFFIEDLKHGNTIPIYFPRRESSLPNLLAKEEADPIPFTLKDLPTLLHHFSFSKDSPQATAMQETLQECEAKSIKGETKICATSLESMLGFISTIFGSNTKTQSLCTIHLTPSHDARLRKYTIMGINEIPSPKLVSCHTMPYAYVVYYCHYQESESRVYRVSLTGENGDKVEAIAVCHMDTSEWGRNHISFKVLGIEPGSAPVCHFFPSDNFVWVPSTTTQVLK